MQTLELTMTAPRPMEHRWGERVEFDCPALLELPDGARGQGQVRNASISGAWIETTMKLPAYTAATVILALGPGRRTIELPACVVRAGRGGIGVEWRDMGVPTLIALLREAGGDEARLCGRDRAFG